MFDDCFSYLMLHDETEASIGRKLCNEEGDLGRPMIDYSPTVRTGKNDVEAAITEPTPW